MVRRVVAQIVCFCCLFSSTDAQQLVDLPFRGVSCFHCNANAKQARAICATQYAANLKNNAINFLVDGSFGYNFDTMAYCINLLSYGERQLKVLIYVTSGPGLRRCAEYKRLNVKGAFSGICPAQFNSLITSDARFRGYYINHVETRVKPIVEHALAMGAIPMVGWLEDNFTNTAFNSVLSLTAEGLHGLPVSFVRNPMGPGFDLPQEVKLEVHRAPKSIKHTGGFVFTDGAGFFFRRESGWKKGPRITTYSRLRDQAGTTGNTFLLWVDLWQGLTRTGTRIQNPMRRRYPLPRRDEQVEVWRFLRG